MNMSFFGLMSSSANEEIKAMVDAIAVDPLTIIRPNGDDTSRSRPVAPVLPAIVSRVMVLGPPKQENERLDQLDRARGPAETDGWRIGTLLRKGHAATEKIGIVIQVVSTSDLGNGGHGYAYIWVLWENGEPDRIDAPGRGKQDMWNFRNSYTQTYPDGLGDRVLKITQRQLIEAWCALCNVSRR